MGRYLDILHGEDDYYREKEDLFKENKEAVDAAEREGIKVLGGIRHLDDGRFVVDDGCFTMPDDGFYSHGFTLEEWLDKSHLKGSEARFVSSYAEDLGYRLFRFNLAYGLYKALGDPEDLVAYRIIRNYKPVDDCHGEETVYYIFKELNNGTTYRIQDTQPNGPPL
jgi:hypothetical protein